MVTDKLTIDRQSDIARDTASDARAHVTVIEPPRKWIALNLAEIWRYRDLLALLVRRDISARYRQSVAGPVWVVMKPLLSVAIFTLIFGRLAGLGPEGVPYPIFCLAAMIPWMYFSTSLTSASESVVAGSNLVTKVYFPRLILPLASVTTGLIDVLVQLPALALVMAWYRYWPTWKMLALPCFLAISLMTALAVGLWLTALNVKYRDVKQLVPFLAQAWMWLSPIVYPSSIVPEPWRPLYGLNPMVGVIEGFRWAIAENVAPDWNMIGISFAATLVILVSGLFFFRKTELYFADVI